MATWTDIPDSVLEPGKPVRSVDALALRDNPTAIAEGAPGAPRIAGQQGPVVNTGGIFDGAVTSAKLAISSAGSVVLRRLSDLTADPGQTDVTPGAERAFAVAHGVIRVALVHSQPTGSPTSTVRVYRNSNIVGSWTRGSGAAVTRSVDFTVSPGDEIYVWLNKVNAGSTSATQIRIMNSNGSLVVV